MIDFGTEITKAKPIPRHEMLLEAWAWGFNTVDQYFEAIEKAYKNFDKEIEAEISKGVFDG